MNLEEMGGAAEWARVAQSGRMHWLQSRKQLEMRRIARALSVSPLYLAPPTSEAKAIRLIKGGAVSCSPSLGPDQTHQRCILRLFDCPLAGVRDLHADDLDRTSAHLHRISLHARKPVADKICQHLGWEAVLNQHFDGAAARLCICQHFEGSALLRADHYN